MATRLKKEENKVFQGEDFDRHSNLQPNHDAKAQLENSEVAKDALGGTSQDLPKGYYRSPNFVFTVLALCLGQMCCFWGFVLPANILTIINQDLGPDPNFVWIAIIWNLTQAVMFVLVGRLSDLLGRRWIFIIGNAIGLVGAIIASVAPSVPVLIVGGAFLGIGAAVQLSFAAVISELIPNKWRGFGISFVFVFAFPVACFGPVIIRSLILHTKAGWRWSFYIDVIINAIVVLLFYFFYHPPTYQMLHARSARRVPIWKMVDVVGLVLFTGGLLIFLFGISWGGSLYPWKSGRVIGMIIGGALLLILFVFWEIYGAGEHPLIPMQFFKSREYTAIVFVAGVGTMIYYSLLILWPMQIAVIFETDLMRIGWKSCLIGSAALLGQAGCGLFIKAVGKHKYQVIIGTSMLTAFTGAMAATTPDTPKMAVTFIFLASFSLGYMENTVFTIGSFCLKEEDLGSATGIIGCARSSFSTVAQAIFVAILSNKLIENVPRYVVPAVTQAGLSDSSVEALLAGLANRNFSAVPGVNPSIIEAAVSSNKVAQSVSYKIVYLSAIAFGAIGILAAFFVPNIEEKFNNTVSRRLISSQPLKEKHSETDRA